MTEDNVVTTHLWPKHDPKEPMVNEAIFPSLCIFLIVANVVSVWYTQTLIIDVTPIILNCCFV